MCGVCVVCVWCVCGVCVVCVWCVCGVCVCVWCVLRQILVGLLPGGYPQGYSILHLAVIEYASLYLVYSYIGNM